MRFAVGLCICGLAAILLFPAMAVPGSAAPVPDVFSQTRADGMANWTVMVYMSGDSSLSDKVTDDLEEMKLVGSGDGLEIVTIADKDGNDDTRVHHILESGPETFMPNVINASWGDELNMGKAEVLSQFALWAMENYPARHYVLDLWGHGNGWSGVCPDKGDSIQGLELKEAMEDINAGGMRPDIVSMDACQMGMLEMLYQMKGLADFSIASEKDVPFDGWPYDRLLEILRNDSSIGPEEFGPEFVDEYIEWGISNSGYSLTLAFVNITALEGVVSEAGRLADELILDAAHLHPEISAARDDTEEYDGANQYDLLHLARNLANRTGAGVFGELEASLKAAVDEAVVYERRRTRVNDEPADNATGLSIWFPEYSPAYTPDYVNLDFCQETSWDEFLGVYDEVNGGARESLPMESDISSSDSDGDGLADTISVTASGAGDVLEAVFYDDDWSRLREASGTGNISVDWQPPATGYYRASVYLRETDGTLMNHMTVLGLASEKLYTISGRVVSNTGRGLALVRLTVEDPGSGYSGDFTTDASGRFEIELVAPRQTDGLDLNITCHHGTYTQNISVQSLEGLGELRFEIPEGPGYTLPLMYLALGLDVAGLCLVGLYLFGLRRETFR